MRVVSVYVSAVSSEFRNAKELISSELRKRDVELREQEMFAPTGGETSLLGRVHAYISDCDTVICVLGERSGSSPPRAEAARFSEKYESMLERLGGAFEPSYTQWELIFATALDKRLLIYVASERYGSARGLPEEDDPTSQRALLEWIQSERNYALFDSDDDLVRLISREDWADSAGRARGSRFGRGAVDELAGDSTTSGAAALGAGGDTRLVHDGPALIDRLGRENLAGDLAARLVDLVEDSDSPGAFAVHVDGRWGEGKSTLVGFLADDLRAQDPPWTIIEMDAWRSSQMSPAWWALLTHLREGVRDSKHGRDRRRFRRRFFLRETWRLKRVWLPPLVVLATSLVLLALGIDVLGALGAITSIVALAAGLGGFLTGFLGLGSVQGARLHERTNDNPMTEVIDQFDWTRRQTSRPILLVLDDLDRCNERFAVEVLDAVQTLLRTPGSELDKRPRAGNHGASTADIAHGRSSPRSRRRLFSEDAEPTPLVVLALGDQRWLRAAYEDAYAVFSPFVSEPGRPLGHLFLDKLFQVRIELPTLSPDQFTSYLGQLLRPAAGPTSGDAEVDELRRQVVAATTDERDSDDGVDARVTALVTGNDHLSPTDRQELVGHALEARRNDPNRADRERHLLEDYADLLDHNPRSAKRFVMAYNLSYAARLSELAPFSTETLALWTVVTIRWPALADWMRLRVADGTLEPREEEHDDRSHACHLLARPEVQRVLNASDRGGPLNENTLPRYCGIFGEPRRAPTPNDQDTALDSRPG